MKIASIQMVSTSDVLLNLNHARHAIAKAADQGAQLVCLPEYFCMMGQEQDRQRCAEHFGEGPIQEALRDWAKRYKVWLVGGTLPLIADLPNKFRNACLLIDPQGEIKARYDKMHLFAFDNGQEFYDEGLSLQAGTQPVALSLEVGEHRVRIGLSICYDVRFPELYRAMMQPPCDILFVPSAFTYTTGKAHWEPLLRARAIENQCYVVAAAQGGHHQNGRHTWGHSMIIDPWGEVLDSIEQGPGIALANCSLAQLASVRKQLPALQHRLSTLQGRL